MTGTVTLVCAILFSFVILSEGNWYGKRGSEVDDAFQRYLEGRLAKSIGTQNNLDRETLMKISKVLKEWQMKIKEDEVAGATPFERK